MAHVKAVHRAVITTTSNSSAQVYVESMLYLKREDVTAQRDFTW